MNQVKPYLMCLILMAIGTNLFAQNVQVDPSIQNNSFTAERVLEVKFTTNADERLENIVNNPTAQQAFDNKVANSNPPNALPVPQTVTIERNLANDTNFDVSSIRNN